MQAEAPTQAEGLQGLVTAIVSAYVSNNSVPMQDLPTLIRSVRAALSEGEAPAPSEDAPATRTRPVSLKKSITPEYLISMEDGKQYRTLTRHLRGRGLTPEQYREKWGLPRDYPMVAPAYSERRSELAKSLGLGQARRQKADAEKPAGGKKRNKRATEAA